MHLTYMRADNVGTTVELLNDLMIILTHPQWRLRNGSYALKAKEETIYNIGKVSRKAELLKKVYALTTLSGFAQVDYMTEVRI